MVYNQYIHCCSYLGNGPFQIDGLCNVLVKLLSTSKLSIVVILIDPNCCVSILCIVLSFSVFFPRL